MQIAALSTASADRLDTRLAEASLAEFTRLMWPEIEPGRPLVWGRVPKIICEHLEAVVRGESQRLCINLPPGCLKSTLVNIMLPAWVWGPKRQPEKRFLSVSYSEGLTRRDNLSFATVIESESYQRRWGGIVRRHPDLFSQTIVGNTRRGWKMAGSTGGGITGWRADYLCLDDPNNVKSVESEAVRESAKRFLLEVLPSRVADPATSATIVIQQRTHQEDVSGVIEDIDLDYDRLVIPMRYEGERQISSLGTEDWRTEPGELCWPERFSESAVAELERSLGEYGSSGQLQQRPTVRGGAILKTDWWQTYGDPDDPQKVPLPRCSLIVASLDGAYTERDSNDPSGFTIWGVYSDPGTAAPRLVGCYAWATRLPLHELVLEVDRCCRRYRASVLLIENKATGISVGQELARLFDDAPYSVVLVDPSGQGDKVARAYSIAPLLESGVVSLPNTTWARDIRVEAAMFPRGAHDDRVDSIVQALRWLREGGFMERPAEYARHEREAAMHRPKAQPLYPGMRAA